MREAVFSLKYSSECNALANILDRYPDTRIRSISLHATAKSLWQVSHAAGPSDSLDAIKNVFFESDYHTGCLTTKNCGTTQEAQVLEHSNDTLIVYSYWERTPSCTLIPHIALDHLGEGVLFKTRNVGTTCTWRIVHSGSGDTRAFFDELEDNLSGSVDLKIERLTDASYPLDDDTNDELSPRQEEALRTAIEQGYYKMPRDADAADIADELDVPRSTLNYRLRRAEAKLVPRYFDPHF
ncbi:helix-turn-helix domain-containing protein (plasmid) [Haloferax sp. S1W]|uniref:helix-turn-helix domain-containing protein n=1 Tax=Haloferax sp. S1W TaxID=3377110 RepID=UPI0037C53E53